MTPYGDTGAPPQDGAVPAAGKPPHGGGPPGEGGVGAPGGAQGAELPRVSGDGGGGWCTIGPCRSPRLRAALRSLTAQ